jgi:hypothetical protein
MARKGSAGESGKGAATVGTTVDLCATPITAVLDDMREITMGHCVHCSRSILLVLVPQHTPSRHAPTKPLVPSDVHFNLLGQSAVQLPRLGAS